MMDLVFLEQLDSIVLRHHIGGQFLFIYRLRGFNFLFYHAKRDFVEMFEKHDVTFEKLWIEGSTCPRLVFLPWLRRRYTHVDSGFSLVFGLLVYMFFFFLNDVLQVVVDKGEVGEPIDGLAHLWKHNHVIMSLKHFHQILISLFSGHFFEVNFI
jgi:hypothetical protein